MQKMQPILQPACDETQMVVEYCTEQAQENCAIRLIIGPSPRRIQLPKDYHHDNIAFPCFQ